MISLTNAYLANLNQPPMGWVNPFLYQFSNKFINDVTSGSNRGLSGNSSCNVCQYGYYAGQGWDPVSGLGTLNLKSFIEFASNTTISSPTTSVSQKWKDTYIIVGVIGAVLLISFAAIGYYFYNKRALARSTTASTVTGTTTNIVSSISETRSPLTHKV
jgi:hypothetical protein